MTATPATTAQTAQVADVLALQADISAQLTQLAALADLVTELVDSRQRGLGFLTPAARQMIDAQVVADRVAQRTQPEQDRGMKWLNRSTYVAGTGHVPAPATVPVVSFEAEMWAELRHLVRHVVRALHRAGVCVLAQLPAEPTTGVLLAHLRELVYAAPSPSLLLRVTRTLDGLIDAATLVVDGNDRAQLGDDCPHCGHPTLVVWFKDDVIRCDRDPRTGHYSPCQCPDEFCDCKQKPVSFRHEWHRTEAAARARRNTWYALANLLTARRQATRPDNEGTTRR